jgi:hypothetical protein
MICYFLKKRKREGKRLFVAICRLSKKGADVDWSLTQEEMTEYGQTGNFLDVGLVSNG